MMPNNFDKERLVQRTTDICISLANTKLLLFVLLIIINCFTQTANYYCYEAGLYSFLFSVLNQTELCNVTNTFKTQIPTRRCNSNLSDIISSFRHKQCL
jgi:hypothetical protein